MTDRAGAGTIIDQNGTVVGQTSPTTLVLSRDAGAQPPINRLNRRLNFHAVGFVAAAGLASFMAVTGVMAFAQSSLEGDPIAPVVGSGPALEPGVAFPAPVDPTAPYPVFPAKKISKHRHVGHHKTRGQGHAPA
jgi:hypothetical protein